MKYEARLKRLAQLYDEALERSLKLEERIRNKNDELNQLHNQLRHSKENQLAYDKERQRIYNQTQI